MAEYINVAIKQSVIPFLAAGSLFITLQTAYAQSLVDPTRPPNALSAAESTGDASAASKPVLQSVLIAPHRMEAIISGQTVKVGDKVGDARVARISEGEVVLRNSKGSLVLRLFPGIEKRTEPNRISSTVAEKRQQ